MWNIAWICSDIIPLLIWRVDGCILEPCVYKNVSGKNSVMKLKWCQWADLVITVMFNFFLLFLRKKHYELSFSLRHLMAITNITVKNVTRNVMLIKDWNFPSFLTSSHYIWNVLTLIILLFTESNSMTSEYIVKEAVLAMHDLHPDSSADKDSSLLSCYANAVWH